MSSFTLTLNGRSSELSANYYPPIELDRDAEYVCGLVDFQTYMSIPNVNNSNNKLYFVNNFKAELLPELANLMGMESKIVDGVFYLTKSSPREIMERCALEMASRKNVPLKDARNVLTITQAHEGKRLFVSVEYLECITIPIGSYEFDDIAKYLSNEMSSKGINAYLYLEISKNTLKCELKSNITILFDGKRNTIGSLLGFADGKLDANILHTSDLIVKISSTNVIKLETNITSGAYSNEKLARTLHEFYPSVDIGYKIVEVPSPVIYLPVAVRSIHNFVIRITDQEGNLIDFRGETITLRVHIKRL